MAANHRLDHLINLSYNIIFDIFHQNEFYTQHNMSEKTYYAAATSPETCFQKYNSLHLNLCIQSTSVERWKHFMANACCQWSAPQINECKSQEDLKLRFLQLLTPQTSSLDEKVNKQKAKDLSKILDTSTVSYKVCSTHMIKLMLVVTHFL